jgi:hypothetical protein
MDERMGSATLAYCVAGSINTGSLADHPLVYLLIVILWTSPNSLMCEVRGRHQFCCVGINLVVARQCAITMH